MLAVNVGGVVQGTELARDSFRVSGKGGVVINTASVAGLQGLPGSAVYSGKISDHTSIARSRRKSG